MKKSKLIDVINNIDILSFPLESEDIENIESAFYEIEQEFSFIFNIEAIEQCGDYFVDCNYYSESIKKTIIWESEIDTCFESAENFANYLLDTEEKIKNFEKRLSISNVNE